MTSNWNQRLSSDTLRHQIQRGMNSQLRMFLANFRRVAVAGNAGLAWRRVCTNSVRYTSTTSPTVNQNSSNSASNVTGNGGGSKESKGNPNTKKKSSNIPFYIASLLIGAGLAQYLPISSIAKFLISDKLPKPNTPEAEVFRSNLEKELQELPIYKQLSSDPNYEPIRAWNYVDSNALNQLLTSGTLSTPGGFAIKPILFFNKEKKESISIYHVGEKLCGYPFLVHGGILATILDEILKRTSSVNFGIDPIENYIPDKIKTKNIELQYKFPTVVNSFLIVRCQDDGNKVDGRIETLDGKLLVKGVGTFEKRKSFF